jgi:hypothetical protein
MGLTSRNCSVDERFTKRVIIAPLLKSLVRQSGSHSPATFLKKIARCLPRSPKSLVRVKGCSPSQSSPYPASALVLCNSAVVPLSQAVRPVSVVSIQNVPIRVHCCCCGHQKERSRSVTPSRRSRRNFAPWPRSARCVSSASEIPRRPQRPSQ